MRILILSVFFLAMSLPFSVSAQTDEDKEFKKVLVIKEKIKKNQALTDDEIKLMNLIGTRAAEETEAEVQKDIKIIKTIIKALKAVYSSKDLKNGKVSEKTSKGTKLTIKKAIERISSYKKHNIQLVNTIKTDIVPFMIMREKVIKTKMEKYKSLGEEAQNKFKLMIVKSEDERKKLKSSIGKIDSRNKKIDSLRIQLNYMLDLQSSSEMFEDSIESLNKSLEKLVKILDDLLKEGKVIG